MNLISSSITHSSQQHEAERCSNFLSAADLSADPLVPTRLERSSNRLQQFHRSFTNQNIADDEDEMTHETYLSLTRKDINEVINALRTLIDCVYALDTHSESQPLSSHRKCRYYQLNNSNSLNSEIQYHRQQHHRQREHSIRNDSGDNRQTKGDSPFLPNNFLYTYQNKPESNVKIIPQKAHHLEILDNHTIGSIMSVDSFATTKQTYQGMVTNVNESPKIDHRSPSIGTDAATQWSAQNPISKSEQSIAKFIIDSNQTEKENDKSVVKLTMKASPILTDISRSTTTIQTNRSILCLDSNRDTVDPSLNNMSDRDSKLTASETEQFLKTLDLPVCQCSTIKSPSINESIIDLSLDNSLTDKRKRKLRLNNKLNHKRINRSCIKSSKVRQNLKSTIPRQNHKQEDLSSLDLFEMDSVVFDTHDRFFTDT